MANLAKNEFVLEARDVVVCDGEVVDVDEHEAAKVQNQGSALRVQPLKSRSVTSCAPPLPPRPPLHRGYPRSGVPFSSANRESFSPSGRLSTRVCPPHSFSLARSLLPPFPPSLGVPRSPSLLFSYTQAKQRRAFKWRTWRKMRIHMHERSRTFPT